MQELKMQDQYARAENARLETRHKYAGVEIAGLENAENDIVWKTVYYLCLPQSRPYKEQFTPCAVCCDRRDIYLLSLCVHTHQLAYVQKMESRQ